MSPKGTDITFSSASLPAHPRLFARDDDWLRLREDIQSNSVLGRIYQRVKSDGDTLLSEPPVERVMEGRRLLSTSREALRRLLILGTLSHLDGNPVYAGRAIEELKAVASFADWNPSHFLDTAEMAMAVAVGFDWLYHQLDDSIRSQLVTALVTKAIQPSYALHEGRAHSWVTIHNNWNQVCHSGMTAAAIAIAEHHPELAEKVVHRALENLPRAAAAYAPDGAYAEGPMYWSYGTFYHVILSDILQKATGSTWGTDCFPGFLESAIYMGKITAPSGELFNYGDCRIRRGLLAPLFWIARQAGHPEWLNHDIKHLDTYLKEINKETDRGIPLLLHWYNSDTADADEKSVSRHWHAEGITPVTIFGPEGDRNLYVGVKGGSPGSNHAHMDVGSFILEAEGIRWAVDTGLQEYHSLEKHGFILFRREQDSPRWKVFRLGAESHNIIRFNHGSQQVDGRAEFISSQDKGNIQSAVLEMSEIYSREVKRMERGVMVRDNGVVLIQDEWELRQSGGMISWQMMTFAEVSRSVNGLLLQQEGKKCHLQVPDQPGVRIEVIETDTLLEFYDEPNPGLKRISVHVEEVEKCQGSLRVFLIPGDADEYSFPEILSLDQW
jgi:hypothetical protein